MSRTFEQAVDFTRLSAGTRFNRLGLLVTEPDNTKRMQHDPATVNTSTQQINVSSVNRGQALTVALDGDHVYAAGDDVYVTDAGNIDRFVAGRVTAAEAGSVTIEVRRRAGVGAASDWVVIVGLGLLVEGEATNQFLNNESPATQDIALSSGTHTLSFYGTGEIVLSGGATGTLTGTGTERDRVKLAFEADGTAVTFTISGDPVLPQVESGSVATSVIITGAEPATRAADVVSQGEVGRWFNPRNFTIYAESTFSETREDPGSIGADGSYGNVINLRESGTRFSSSLSIINNSNTTRVHRAAIMVQDRRFAVELPNNSYKINGELNRFAVSFDFDKKIIRFCANGVYGEGWAQQLEPDGFGLADLLQVGQWHDSIAQGQLGGTVGKVKLVPWSSSEQELKAMM